MKMFEWIKSLFRKKEIVKQSTKVDNAEVKQISGFKVISDLKPEPAVTTTFTTSEEIKSKKRKRGRPRKKKVEQK